MMNTGDTDRLIGFLKAVAFYLEKAQQEANALKVGKPKNQPQMHTDKHRPENRNRNETPRHQDTKEPEN
jgi:hypothetical protein